MTDLRDAAAASLLSHCPHWRDELQFNPFFAAANDYVEVIRHGLNQSRREKGDDHEEVLAYLIALALHVEKLGLLDEARAISRERDALAPRVAARKERQQCEREMKR